MQRFRLAQMAQGVAILSWISLPLFSMAQDASIAARHPTKAALDNLYQYGKDAVAMRQCLDFAEVASKEGDEPVVERACQAAANIIVRTNDRTLFDMLVESAENSAEIRRGLVGTYPQLTRLPGDEVQRERLARTITRAGIEGKDEFYVPYLVVEIVKCAEDESLERELLAEFVLESSSSDGRHAAVAALESRVRAEDIGAFRTALRESITRGELDYPIFLLLSYIGDDEILEDVQRCKATDSACGVDTTRLGWGIKRIELQNPPEQLLSAMKDMSLKGPPGDRVWMIERAIAKGMPTADVREALLEYVAERADADDKSWTIERRKLIGVGQKLGVLSASDVDALPSGPPVPMLDMHNDH